MNNKSHIWLVNTHSECDRGDYDIDFFHQKRVLIGASGRTVHSGVIGECLDVVHCEHLGEFLNLLAAQAIDDA